MLYTNYYGCCRLFQTTIKNCKVPHRVVASGRGQWCPAPPFEIGAPPCHVWPTGSCIHPTLYLKNVAPLSGFWPPLLLNPGDGPGSPFEQH